MHERDYAREHATTSTTLADDGLAPGRASRSSRLDAPIIPMVSGLIQRKPARDDNGVADDANLAVATAASTSGTSLPEPIMRKFESSLGADLSSVRVHTSTESAAAATAVGALAYTTGQDIHFAEGQYDPSSSHGEHLLAHEVAHTVQQRGGTPMRQNKLAVSSPQDAAEHEADRAADAMVTGGSATIGGFAPAIARKEDNTSHKGTDVGAKLSSKGVDISLNPKLKTTTKTGYADGKFAVGIKATGSLEWPDLLPGAKIEAGGKRSDGETETSVGIEHEIPVYEREVAKRANEADHDEGWADYFEVDKVDLVTGAETGMKHEGLELGASLGVEVTFKRGVKLTGTAKLINLTTNPPEISGPAIEGMLSIPILHKEWELGHGVTFKGSLSVEAKAAITPNWTAIAQQAASFFTDLGAAGAIEAAATLAIIAAPALCLASAISMIEDETQLIRWIYAEAAVRRETCVALAAGTAMRDGDYSSHDPRVRNAYNRGWNIALATLKAQKLTLAAYRMSWEKTGSNSFDYMSIQTFDKARSAFVDEAAGRARTMFEHSLSMGFWKEKEPVIQKARDEAAKAFITINNHLDDLTLPE